MSELSKVEISGFGLELNCEYEEHENMIEVTDVFREFKVAVDIAVRLNEMEVDDEIIAEATGLTLNDVNIIKSK